MNRFGVIGVVLAKFVVPVMIIYFPFWGMWENYVLDVVDGDVLGWLGMADVQYQMIDKSADLWSYVCMVIVARHWRINKVVMGLFIYRLIGQVLFFVTGDELWFVWFQNFLEPLMLVYVSIMFVQKTEEKTYAVYMKYLWLWWAIIIGYKLWNEWYLHYANIDLSTLLLGINGNL